MSDAALSFRPAGAFRSGLYGLLRFGSNLCHRTGSAFECLAAGVLRRSDLRAAMEFQFRNFSTAPDEVDEGLNPFEVRLYRQWLPSSGRILLVGCGAGRDLIGLTNAGHAVTGLEPVGTLAQAARSHLERHGLAAPIIVGSIETVDLVGRFDAVVFAPACYSNIQSATVRSSALARLKRHLTDDGRIIISYIASESIPLTAAALMRVTSTLTGADWWPESGDSFHRYHESRGGLYFERAFRAGEVALEGRAAGFRVLDEYVNPHRANAIVLTPAEPAARPINQPSH